MYAHYFDIETYSPNEKPNPETDKIITIQFQKIDLKTGEKVGKFEILKEWEEGEEEMLKFIYKWFFRRPWDFIPIGFNLNFEWKFIQAKFKKYNICNNELSYYFDNLPQIDLKSIAIIKKGEFFGASLSFISNKKDDGNVIKEYYENKNYNKILEYVEDEMNSFVDLYKKLKVVIDKNL